jgi:hypothetical protein
VNDVLKQLIERFVEEPRNLEVTKAIRNLRVAEVDFSDDLLDSFDAVSRRRIYNELLLWTDKTNYLKILERRADSETEWECHKKLEFLIMALKSQPPV